MLDNWQKEQDWKELKKWDKKLYKKVSEFCEFVFTKFLPDISKTVINVLGKDSCPVLSQMKWIYLEYLEQKGVNVGKFVVLNCRPDSNDFLGIVDEKFTKEEQKTLICKEPFSYSGFSLSIKKPNQQLESWLLSRINAAWLRKCPFIIVQRCANSRREIKFNFFDGKFLGATSCDDVLKGAAVTVLNLSSMSSNLKDFLLKTALPVIYAADSPFSVKGAIRIDCLLDVNNKWFILEVENVSAGMTAGDFPHLYTNFYCGLFDALSLRITQIRQGPQAQAQIIFSDFFKFASKLKTSESNELKTYLGGKLKLPVFKTHAEVTTSEESIVLEYCNAVPKPVEILFRHVLVIQIPTGFSKLDSKRIVFSTMYQCIFPTSTGAAAAGGREEQTEEKDHVPLPAMTATAAAAAAEAAAAAAAAAAAPPAPLPTPLNNSDSGRSDSDRSDSDRSDSARSSGSSSTTNSDSDSSDSDSSGSDSSGSNSGDSVRSTDSDSSGSSSASSEKSQTSEPKSKTSEDDLIQGKRLSEKVTIHQYVIWFCLVLFGFVWFCLVLLKMFTKF